MIFATEKSRELCKWCILLCHGLVSLSLNLLPPNDLKKYLHRIEQYSNINNDSGNNNVVDEVSEFDEKKTLQNEEISSNDEKKALISSEQLVNSSTTTTTTLNIPPPISPIGQVSLKKFEKQILDQYRPIISSPLNPNKQQQSSNNNNNKTNSEDDNDKYLSKRYSTIANSRPKRTQTMKLISSTAIYRFFNQKSNVLSKTSSTDPEEFNYTSNKKSSSKSNNNDKDDNNLNSDDKNIRLDCERPTFYQQPRKSHKNLSPAVTLQVSRKYLKLMVRIRRHRNTI